MMADYSYVAAARRLCNHALVSAAFPPKYQLLLVLRLAILNLTELIYTKTKCTKPKRMEPNGRDGIEVNGMELD